MPTLLLLSLSDAFAMIFAADYGHVAFMSSPAATRLLALFTPSLFFHGLMPLLTPPDC